jgi:hypothetical protein
MYADDPQLPGNGSPIPLQNIPRRICLVPFVLLQALKRTMRMSANSILATTRKPITLSLGNVLLFILSGSIILVIIWNSLGFTGGIDDSHI